MYILPIPQRAQRNKSKTYNLDKKITEVFVVKEYPNGMMELKDLKEKHYQIPSYYYNVSDFKFIPDTWEGKTAYLLFDKLDDAKNMHDELLNKIIGLYTEEINKLSSKVKDIERIINNLYVIKI